MNKILSKAQAEAVYSTMGEVYIKCMNGEKMNVERIRG